MIATVSPIPLRLSSILGVSPRLRQLLGTPIELGLRSVYPSLVGKKKDSTTGLGWRLFWGVVGAGLTATVLSVSGYELAPPVLIGISIAMGIVVAIGGPMLLDLLTLT